MVLGTPGFLLQLPALFRSSVLAAAIAVAISVLQLIALYLAFTGTGVRWFAT